jgi:integrating conjugative element protein (TIGR03749 family)
VYLRASEPIEPTRLQLQDADTGALILLDIAAEPPKDGGKPNWSRCESSKATALQRAMAISPVVPTRPRRAPRTRQGREQRGAKPPVPVVLTRFAAQNLYAPLRTVEPLPGVMRVNLRRDMDLGTLMPTLPVRALALASWRLGRPVGHRRALDQHGRGLGHA